MELNFEFMWTAFKDIIHYIPTTLKLTLGALVIALPIAILFAFINYKKVPVISQICKLLISVIRGTPVILHMYLLYNLMPSLLNNYYHKIGSSKSAWDINTIYFAYIALSLFVIVNLAEAFRSALQTVDKGQFEAADTVGMSRLQTYIRVVIPQAFVSALPIMCNTTIDLMKSTSLAFSMLICDITGRAKTIAGIYLSYVECYLDVLIIYIVLILLVEKGFKLFEKRVSRYMAA